MEPVGREEIMLSLKSTSANEVDRISRRRIKFCERSRDLSETRGLSQDGTIVDKEFLPRFRYVNRLRCRKASG